MTTPNDYAAWIAANGWDAPDKAWGRCQIAAKAMAAAFSPELRVARGILRHTSAGYSNGRAVAHWWCVDETGQIVDPTASQYALVEILSYRELRPEEIEGQLRRCPNCGELFFGDGTVCCVVLVTWRSTA